MTPVTDLAVKQVFPTLDVIGWYSVGATPSDEDLRLQEQVRPAPVVGDFAITCIRLLARGSSYDKRDYDCGNP
jgi:hypothetical protein